MLMEVANVGSEHETFRTRVTLSRRFCSLEAPDSNRPSASDGVGGLATWRRGLLLIVVVLRPADSPVPAGFEKSHQGLGGPVSGRFGE